MVPEGYEVMRIIRQIIIKTILKIYSEYDIYLHYVESIYILI